MQNLNFPPLTLYAGGSEMHHKTRGKFIPEKSRASPNRDKGMKNIGRDDRSISAGVIGLGQEERKERLTGLEEREKGG
jgi:hypothetical protein